MAKGVETSAAEVAALVHWLEAAARALGGKGKAAAVAGVSPQQFSRWVNGDSLNPSAVTLARLASASGLSLDSLLGGPRASAATPPTVLSNPPQSVGAPLDIPASRLATRVALALQRLYAEHRKMPADMDLERAVERIVDGITDLATDHRLSKSTVRGLALWAEALHHDALHMADSSEDTREVPSARPAQPRRSRAQ